jgi:hypothetical protein
MKNENELLIPPGAEEDPKAMEVIRVWVAKGGQHVSLNPLVGKTRKPGVSSWPI